MNSRSKKTVVIGASPNTSRYSYLAVERLVKHGHEVVAVGKRKGEISGLEIQTEMVKVDNVDTVSLYVGPQNQSHYKDYIIDLKPSRVILNPGTFNPDLVEALEENKIEAIEACTLVMLSANTY